MVVEIGSEIHIRDASKELNDWAQENMIIPNPQYRERERRGLWIGNTPKYLWLYRIDGSDLILPTGVGKQVRQFLSENDRISVHLAIRATFPCTTIKKRLWRLCGTLAAESCRARAGLEKHKWGLHWRQY